MEAYLSPCTRTVLTVKEPALEHAATGRGLGHHVKGRARRRATQHTSGKSIKAKGRPRLLRAGVGALGWGKGYLFRSPLYHLIQKQ